MINKLIFSGLLLLFFTTCDKPKNRIVDQELEKYVDRFFQEAALREIEVIEDNLEVVFRDLTSEGVCGLGYFEFEGTNLRKVEINPNLFCWETQDEFARESLVFHELGHAILNRIHESSNLPNGLPANIMCDGNICDIFSLYDQYTQGKRAYYLDKLFWPNNVAPDWGKIKRKVTPFFIEKVETDTPIGQLEFSNLETTSNFSQTIAINPTSNSESIQLIAKEKIPNSASWVIRLDNPTIEEGLGLRLKANITTEDIDGKGINIALRTLSGHNEPLTISAIANSTIITDTKGEKPYEVVLNYYPSDVQQIELIVQIQTNTAGTIYIDDIQLDIMEVE